MKKVLFYRTVTQFSAEEFISSINTNIDGFNTGVEVDVNSPGGSDRAGWGMIKAFRDYKGSKKVVVHGEASSMMFYFLLFAQWVVAITQSKSVVHRAAFANEQNLSETDKLWLEDSNKDLRAAFEKSVNIQAFESIGKSQHGEDFTVDRMFDINQPQIDVILNANQLLEIGVVNQIETLDPQDIFALNEVMASAEVPLIDVQDEQLDNQNSETMNSEELKTKYPAAVAKIEKDAQAEALKGVKDAAVEDERNRVAAWNAWRDVDPEAVEKGIESGKEITQAESNKFMAKAAKLSDASNLTDTDGDDVQTDEVDADDQSDEDKVKAKNLEAARKEAKAAVNKFKH